MNKTVDCLKCDAKKRGLKGYSSMNKSQLLDLLAGRKVQKKVKKKGKLRQELRKYKIDELKKRKFQSVAL